MEEQRCSNSSSGGGGAASRPCKKPKQKKVPQRGVGVAQLERMRMEEQQKKAVASSAAPTPSAPCFVVPHPSIPFPMHSSADLPPLFSSAVDLPSPTPPASAPPPLPTPQYPGDRGPPTGLQPLWNPIDFAPHSALEPRKFEPIFPFRPPGDFSPVWRSPSVVVAASRKSNQQQPQVSPMVNMSTSLCSSPGINFHMEPPSNQIYYKTPPPPPPPSLWHEEERTVGMKRPCPFTLDDLLGASSSTPFHCKFPPINTPFHRWDDPSCAHDLFKSELGNASFRESPSGLNAIRTLSDDLNLSKSIKENTSPDGRFLTLGPLATSSNPKSKQPVSVPFTSHSQFNLLPFQGSMECSFLQPGQPQQPFYIFLPMGPSSHPVESSDERIEGTEGIVNLNLKL